MLPSRPTAIPTGLASVARVAGPPSPPAASDAVPGHRVDNPVRPDPPNAVVERIGEVEAAVWADLHTAHLNDLGEAGRTAVAAEAGGVGPGDRVDDAVGCHLAHSVPTETVRATTRVGEVVAVVGPDGHLQDTIELRLERWAAVAARR